ncbi:MAG: D-sedoheptulose 7-phosphate isomerase [Thermodesulfobacteriota bacterium]|nr:D-sedoheptulose 7-phosphate isomerase [Thermodesulfobacteriota bacterium]
MNKSMENLIAEIAADSYRVKNEFIKQNTKSLILLARNISNAFKNKRKLMLCGNGGSAADAQHISAEFVNRFQLERQPLPALALTTDTSIITSIANDYGYEKIYSKQISALGAEGDILLSISTSGNSPNIISGIMTAKKMGIYTVGLGGRDGGEMTKLADLSMVVGSNSTPRIQEVHILTGHLICELVDYILFK